MSAVTDWLQAVGTVGALGGVVYEMRRRRKDDERAEVERLHQTAAQARLIRIVFRKTKGVVSAGVHNLSKERILDVEIELVLGSYGVFGFQLGHIDPGAEVVKQIDLGQSARPRDPKDSEETFTFLVFMDANGLLWLRHGNDSDPVRWEYAAADDPVVSRRLAELETRYEKARQRVQWQE